MTGLVFGYKAGVTGQGRSQTFSFGGATGMASFATRGAVNGLCRTFRKRPEKFWGGSGGARQNFWGEVAPPGIPLAPPLSLGGVYSRTNKSLVVVDSRAPLARA